MNKNCPDVRNTVTDHGTRFGVVVAELKGEVADGLSDTFNTHPLIVREPVVLQTHELTRSHVCTYNFNGQSVSC